jgi:hypothetical protein
MFSVFGDTYSELECLDLDTVDCISRGRSALDGLKLGAAR